MAPPTRSTKNIRVEIDVTFDATKTPAQITAIGVQVKDALAGIAGVTIGDVKVTSYAPSDFPGWADAK